ncbi:MAG: ABC-2 transporter permease [Firmicutes bacterium]|nr:ABC-2 transporter permease [Bacillota bacterium]
MWKIALTLAWQLAWKDLYLQKKKLLWLMVTAGLIISILVSVNDIGFLPAILIFVFIGTYSFTIQTCFYEDKNNSLSFVRALPVSTVQIVAGRFLALAVVTVCALLIGCLALLAFQLVNPSALYWFRIGAYGVFAGLANLCFNCLVVFIYYRWGYARMQYVYAVTFMTLFFGGMTVGTLFPSLPEVIAGISPLHILASAVMAAIAVMFFLWNASVNALNKLDLT